MRRITLAVGLVLLGTGSLAAQREQSMPLILQSPGSTRALGLGNAYLFASPDADAIFYNPGLLDVTRGVSVSMARYGGESSLFSAAAAVEWFRGGIGIGLQALSYGANSLDDGAFSQGEAGLSEGGPLGAAEHVASVAYARALFGFRLGVAAKLIEQRLPGENDITAAADLGVARALGPVLLGLSTRNLGRDPRLEDFEAELPVVVALGASSRAMPLGPLDLIAAASTAWHRSDRFEAGGGVEVSYWPISGRTFFARVGARWIEDSDALPLTLGAGFSGDRISIDYAFQDFEDAEPAHRVTLKWR
jgi:hypothetical protein